MIDPHFVYRGDLGALAAFKQHAKARATFKSFMPGHRREYTEWITMAKREEAPARRLARALGWLAEGKTRYWKYAPCRDREARGP